MATRLTDTSPAMESLQAELLRAATPFDRMKMLIQINDFARSVALAGLKTRLPHAGEVELRRRLADLLLGASLAQKVYGDGQYAG